MSDNYSTYVDGVLKLIGEGRPDPLKDVIYARLKGETHPVHNLVSPSLSRDEGDENAVFYFIYNKLEVEKKETELMLLRRSIIELLTEEFHKKESLPMIDALGQMAGVFQVKKFTKLAEQLKLQLWGYMETRLGNPLGSTPFIDMMHLGKDEMEYACRALDLWLTVTPPLPPDGDAPYYDKIIDLFLKAINEFTYSNLLRFYLLTLLFRAAIKVRPYETGMSLFYKMCELVEKFGKKDSTHSYLNGWFGFCNEIGILFDYSQEEGKKWKELFVKGIHERDENLEYGEFFWKSLDKMNGLGRKIKSDSRKPQNDNIIYTDFKQQKRVVNL